jgi:methylenetetrahydrofolate dehydrogenase (NADP+)/methenyltetrahydrofolate cyclohydrolase
MIQLIEGEKIAEEVIESIEENQPEGTPKLQIIYAGENRASEVFIEEKTETAERLGFNADVEKFSQEVDETEVIEFIEKKNQDPEVDGILVQLPLPSHIDNNRIFETVSPEKDVDCLTPENLGKLLRGNPWIKPCAVEGIERILESEQIQVEGKEIVIINNSNLIGKPLSMDLTRKEATVTLCHEKTEKLGEHTRDADIIVTATGEKGLIKDEMVSEDTVIIDAGYSYTEGDLNQETDNLDDISKLSSVPGGLGPVTVAMTMKNLVKCFERQK